MQQLKINWQNRFDALEPTALVAFDETAIRLAKKLLSFADERLGLLQGVWAENLLFVAGRAENLPWVDGVIYLGKDAAAPSILLPTTVRPNVPIDLFERALRNQFSDKLPFAVVENRIIPVGGMGLIVRKVLVNWSHKKL